MRTVVVLPTYNEAENITSILDRVAASPIRPDVLVVDDSSPDATASLVRQWSVRNPGRAELLSRPAKQGLGAAYRAGFAHALSLGYDRVAQMDADGSHPAEALARLAAALDQGADLAIGSRYAPGGRLAEDWPRRRKALSKAGNLYARTLLGLPCRDLTGGFKMWDAATLAALDLGTTTAAGYGFQIQTTLAAARAGARITEVPILFAEREHGVSKMSNAIVLEAMRAVLTMRAHNRRDAHAAAAGSARARLRAGAAA